MTTSFLKATPTARVARTRCSRTRAAAVALTVAALAAGACAPPSGAPPAGASAGSRAATLVGVENVAIADSGVVATGPTLSGTITAERQATVRAQLGGTVLETFAEPGQRVTGGQPLARLSSPSATAAVTSARAAVASAQTAAATAAHDLSRQQQLYAVEGVAARDVESARQTSASAQASLASAHATLAGAEEQAGYARVAAPFTGAVSERSVSVGDVVQAGAALYTVIDPGTLQLEASVPAEQLSTVRVGAPVDFTVRGYPNQTFTGRVVRVNPAADPSTRQVRLYAALPNVRGVLVSGLFASGRLSGERRRGIVVPAAAVDHSTTQPAVARVRAGRVERVTVDVGLSDERSGTVLVSGVARGDTLLTGSALSLAAGTAVRITGGDVGVTHAVVAQGVTTPTTSAAQ